MQFLQLIFISKTKKQNYIENINLARKTLKMKKLTFTLLATAIFGMSSVSAQTTDSKFYGGAELGSSKLDNQTGTVTSSLVRSLGGSASATQDSSVTDYRFFGGYNFDENVGVELGYMQTSKFGMNVVGRSSGGTNYTASISAKYSGFDYSAIFRPSVASGYNNLFARIGFTNYKGESTATASVSSYSSSASSSTSGSGNIYGFGYDAPLNSNMNIRMSLNKLTKIAGESDSSATIYSIGFTNRF